ENRLGRLEADVSRLSTVPEAVARIEEKLTALTERASGNSNVLQTVGLGIVMSVVTGAIGFMQGKRSKPERTGPGPASGGKGGSRAVDECNDSPERAGARQLLRWGHRWGPTPVRRRPPVHNLSMACGEGKRPREEGASGGGARARLGRRPARDSRPLGMRLG